MHAKLTRDRKKCFISVLQKTVEDLVADIQSIRDALARDSIFAAAHDLASQTITPPRSSMISPSVSSSHQETDDDVSAYCEDEQDAPAELSMYIALSG